MEEMKDHALLMEALSEKVLHQLPLEVWRSLFLGEGRESIHFEQRGSSTLAFFRAQGRLWCTPLGAQAEPAACAPIN